LATEQATGFALPRLLKSSVLASVGNDLALALAKGGALAVAIGASNDTSEAMSLRAALARIVGPAAASPGQCLPLGSGLAALAANDNGEAIGRGVAVPVGAALAFEMACQRRGLVPTPPAPGRTVAQDYRARQATGSLQTRSATQALQPRRGAR
jgi:hypothetical protein